MTENQLEELLYGVIVEHVSWHSRCIPRELAADLRKTLTSSKYANEYAQQRPGLTDDDVEAVRRIIFPSQIHPDDIEWARKTIGMAVHVADLMRNGK